ncbi:hypothetical protein F4818DRAFT_437605 [Hypoxylon cercidicola]|nr:hypothetical protein F4818DRAFT_437605 [Hypoxylon cercidicola]
MAAQIPPGTDLWNTPAGPAPDGVTSVDLQNPATNENIASVTLSIFIVLATLFVGLRLYVQLRITKQKPWWDDLALALALPPQIAYTGITIWMCDAGLISRHIWETPLGVVLFRLPYWTVVVAALPQPITGLVKLSLLLLYFRIFKPNRLVRYGIIFGMVIVTLMYIVWMFVFIFQTAFNNEIGSHLSWAQAAFNLATDVYIMLLPISAVARLHVSPKRKLGIAAVFLTGIAAIVMSILTLYWRVQYNGQSPDATWTVTTRLSIIVLEIDVGIMCACMPLFAPLVPGKARLANWTSYVRSMRSRLLRSSPTTQRSTENASHPHYSNASGEVGQKWDSSMELGERTPSSGRNGSRKEWFDRSTVMDQTVQDRNSRDVTDMP